MPVPAPLPGPPPLSGNLPAGKATRAALPGAPPSLSGSAGAMGAEVTLDPLPPLADDAPPSGWRRAVALANSAIEWVFGVAALLVGLSLLAVVPLLQLISLGYLLEVAGRVAATGKLREGFVDVRRAARLGGVALGVLIVCLPLRLAVDYYVDAQWIDPAGQPAQQARAVVFVVVVLTAMQLAAAVLRGAKLRHFLTPPNPITFVPRLFRAETYRRVRDDLWRFVISLRMGYYFWLGLRGFVGSLIWLALPGLLLAASSRLEAGPATLTGLVGALLLATVTLYLPFAQAQFAAEDRFKAIFEVGRLRAKFRAAPIMFWAALSFTLLAAVPLYLLKIETVPREAAWLPALFFVASVWPARFLTGWAMARGAQRATPRHFIFRWAARLAMLPVVFHYVLIVYFSQFTSWSGALTFFEQHAFLLPTPPVGI